MPLNTSGQTNSHRGIQFLAFHSLAGFPNSPGAGQQESVYTSPEIRSQIHWDEAIVSWNAEVPTNTCLRIEARAIFPDRLSKWYVLGLWSTNPERYPRESVRRQRDTDGDVDTDTLILKQPTDRFQLRLTLGGDGEPQARVEFLGVALLDSKHPRSALAPNRKAWGKTIPVPERSQMAYENGGVLCSPTTVSMILAHWSQEKKQPALDHDVPEVVKGVYDPQWEGTGNWVFNTAYAGSLPGMRAYTARLSDLAEVEDFIARGIPVGMSVCYNRLRGRPPVPSGHLVVCVGFTETGEVVINDPGTRQNVRKVFPRARVVDAWEHSKNAVYLIYPESQRLPTDRFGHWDSRRTRWRAPGGTKL